jgi:hypothetical protein
MLAVTSDVTGCCPKAPGICDDPQTPLIITDLG